MVEVWTEFGWIACKLTHLRTPIHLAVTANVPLSFIYDKGLKQRARRLARLRGEQVDFSQLFSKEVDEITRNIETDR